MKLTIIRKVEVETTEVLRMDKALAEAERRFGNRSILTLPQLIDARLFASLEDPLWENWFMGFSGEYHLMDKRGNKLYAVAHGQGPFAKSRRWTRAIEDPEQLPFGYSRISDRESAQVLKDAIPLEEVKGKNLKLPDHYTLVGKVGQMKILLSGMASLDYLNLRMDDCFLMRVGSEERRYAYLDKMKKEFQWQRYGNWHMIEKVNYDTHQGRVLFVDISNHGLLGSNDLDGDGRSVGVGAEGALRTERTHKTLG